MSRWTKTLGPKIAHKWRLANRALHPFVTNLEHSPVVQLMAIFGGLVAFFVIIATAFQIRSDLDEAQEERALRAENAIERRWDRLLRPASGNIGKGEALNFLFRQRVGFDGIDLSCEAVGGYSSSGSTCRRRPILTDISLRQDPALYQTPRSIVDVSFRDARIIGMSIEGLRLYNIDLRGAELTRPTLRDTSLAGQFGGARLDDVHFVQSSIRADDDGLPLALSGDISGSAISFLDRMGPDMEVHAWADHPPLRLLVRSMGKVFGALPLQDHILRKVTLCKPPAAQAGRLLPLTERSPISSVQTNTFPGSIDFRCYPMDLVEAKAAYPKAYQPRSLEDGSLLPQ